MLSEPVPGVPPELCVQAGLTVSSTLCSRGLAIEADARVLAGDPGAVGRPLPPQPKQEKVKLGFQLYRPPTLLAQASPEVLSSLTSYFTSCCLSHCAGDVPVLTSIHLNPEGCRQMKAGVRRTHLGQCALLRC